MKNELPTKWRRGNEDDAYARAKGQHIASVVEGVVEPARSAHTVDRRMKMKSSPEVDGARAGIPGEGDELEPTPLRKLRDVVEEPQNKRSLDEPGSGHRWNR